jgi:hypothetical protein
MWSTRHSGRILIKFEFSGQIFETYWNIKFHEIPSLEGELLQADEKTDG